MGGIIMQWGGDDDGVELQFDPDGTISILIDVNGEMSECRAFTINDAAVWYALAWAYKLT